MTELDKLEEKDIINMINNFDNNNKKPIKKKGFFKRLFSKKDKRMVENNTNDVKVEQEVQNKEVKEQPKVEEPKVETTIEEPKIVVEPVDESIRVDNAIEIDNSIQVVEEPKVEEIKEDYKIATFTIKVKNKDVGKVLSKIGEYATELETFEQVEHSDLTIIDE